MGLVLERLNPTRSLDRTQDVAQSPAQQRLLCARCIAIGMRPWPPPCRAQRTSSASVVRHAGAHQGRGTSRRMFAVEAASDAMSYFRLPCTGCLACFAVPRAGTGTGTGTGTKVPGTSVCSL